MTQMYEKKIHAEPHRHRSGFEEDLTKYDNNIQNYNEIKHIIEVSQFGAAWTN